MFWIFTKISCECKIYHRFGVKRFKRFKRCDKFSPTKQIWQNKTFVWNALFAFSLMKKLRVHINRVAAEFFYARAYLFYGFGYRVLADLWQFVAPNFLSLLKALLHTFKAFFELF